MINIKKVSSDLLILVLLAVICFQGYYVYSQGRLIDSQEENIIAKKEMINTLTASISDLQVELSYSQAERTRLSEELDDLKTELLKLEEREAQLQKFKRWRDGIVDYDELKEWLRKDGSERLAASWSGECTKNLIMSGEENGWDMAHVTLGFEFRGKGLCVWLCAIELSDRGEVWIIPWKDEVIEPCRLGDKLPPSIHGGKYHDVEIVDIMVVY